MRVKITIGRLKVADIDSADPQFILSEAGRYFYQYFEEFIESDAKTMTLKLEKKDDNHRQH